MYQTIVVGAGQAGLAIGYYLKKLNHSFLILDKSQYIGEVWEKRYDSLVLFTPRLYNSLPGLKINGHPHGFPTKDEISRYLYKYAETFKLPIKYNTEVVSIQKENNIFSVDTNGMNYHAKNVIVATGPFQKPKIPTFADNLSSDIVQLHSSKYQNPSQLQKGNVLVVGGGNSGAQIAVELAKKKKTYLSISQQFKFLPLTIGNKSIFWWFDKVGILKANATSFIGKTIQKKGDPVFGKELEKSIHNGEVTVMDRAIGAERNRIIFKNNHLLEIDNVIWATGFSSDYSFLNNIPGVVDQMGKPSHNRGITKIKGLYFLGLPWQYRRGSALLQGVGYDAKYLMKYIQTHD